MNKKEVISFFDLCADGWDASTVRNEKAIEKILEKGGIKKGADVLDVACGTGVLFPDYEKIGVASLTGIDISPKMIEIATKKFPGVKLICGDAETLCFEEQFDAIMIHNAFPHFSSGDALFQNLAKQLKKGGRLTVAHSISRKELEKCHSGTASSVSLPLPEAEHLGKTMGKYLKVDTLISDDEMYIVSGIRLI